MSSNIVRYAMRRLLSEAAQTHVGTTPAPAHVEVGAEAPHETPHAATDHVEPGTEMEVGDAEEMIDEGLHETVSHGHDGPEQALLFLFIALLIGAAVRKILLELKQRFNIRLPYSVVLLVIGGLLGYGEWRAKEEGREDEEQIMRSLTSWSNIADVPTLLLFIFLPALIYESCMTTDYFVFSNHLGGSLLLAGPGMAVQVVLIAVTGKFMFPYGWGWTECFLFGGILSATDPVAVIGLLKELGVLPDLRVLIEGESVLNDGTAIVVYELCKAVLLKPEASNADHVAMGFRLVLGGPCIGTAFFLMSNFWLKRTKNAEEQTIVTVCTAYLCYFVAEGTSAHVSAVLSVCTLGILMAGFGRTSITEEGHHMIHAFWGMLVFCSDTIIFVLAGAIIVDQAFLSKSAFFFAQDWGLLFALYVVLTLIRLFMVTLVSFYLRQYGHGLDRRVCSWGDFVKSMFIVTWGGLRGAVGLVLALAVNADSILRLVADDPLFCDRVLVFTAGIVVLTLLVNAVTLEFIINLLGLGQPTAAEEKVFAGAQKYLDKVSKSKIDDMQARNLYPELVQARWGLVIQAAKKPAMRRRKDPKDYENDSFVNEMHSFREPSAVESGNKDKDVSNRKVADAYHMRFLLSLKASFSNQHMHGILRARPYRVLMWAVNKAVVTMADKEAPTTSMLRFEWGWLVKSNSLELNNLQRKILENDSLPARFVRKFVHSRVKDHLQMVTAVLKAHLEAENIESNGLGVPYAFDTVLEQSKTVRMMAQAKLAELETKYADIAISLCTETATHLIFSTMEEEVEKLLSLGQITASEAERLLEQIEHQAEHADEMISQSIPLTVAQRVHNVPYFQVISEDDFGFLWSQFSVIVKDFKSGDVIENEGEQCNGMWLILNGTVHTKKDTINPKGQMLPMIQEVIPAGGMVGELEVMARDAGYGSPWFETVVAGTDVSAVHISYEQISEILRSYAEVRQRMWQLYGRQFLLRNTHFFDSPIFIAPEIKFGNAVMRRPAQGHTVRHRIPGLLITGRIRRQDETEQAGISWIDPDMQKDAITFISPFNLLLLFPPEKESKHFADAVVKVLGAKSSLTAQRESLDMQRAARGSCEIPRLGRVQSAGNLPAISAHNVDRAKFSVSSMELTRRQIRDSVDIDRLCGAYSEAPFETIHENMPHDNPNTLENAVAKALGKRTMSPERESIEVSALPAKNLVRPNTHVTISRDPSMDMRGNVARRMGPAAVSDGSDEPEVVDLAASSQDDDTASEEEGPQEGKDEDPKTTGVV
mmetsp:Transcript_4516/g.11338  ORF Transcript_4516/g.11338 Transcript_4516/m.11338 type:complete len:1272 (+) Transcript_4516:68-3883(+)